MTIQRALLDVSTLAGLLSSDRPPVLLDARYSLSGDGPAAYSAGHLPGAVFADIDRDFCGTPGAGGRHPLPDPADLQRALRRLGISDGRPVVVYEGGALPVGSAARVWWTLRWAGHPDVRVLDGGFAAWVAAGHPTTRDVPSPEPGDIVVRPGHAASWTVRDAQDLPGVLVDARIGPRFRGEVEPVDPIAGHIPGAVNQPLAETVDEQGRMLAPSRLREAFHKIGVTGDRPVAAYCGSGITAAQTVLALHEAGIDGALYVGSWSEWIADPARPVAKGDA